MSACETCWMKGEGCALKALALSCNTNKRFLVKLKGKIANDGFKAVSGNHYIAGNHKIPRIWVIVADRHIVRIFMKPDGHLELIGEATPSMKERRKGTPNHSLGRVASSGSGAVHHRLEPRSAPGEKEALSFAHDIADWLDRAVAEDAFDRLVVIAAPHTLGDLRKVLTQKTQGRIIAEINKDLTKMNEKALWTELEKILWF